jgi:pSer/pThr/pTyr-binding forkhead associated (FHA) protein
MPNLQLNFRNKVLADFPLKRGYSLTIGRKKNNGVIIDNLAVSSHHAKIDSVGDSFVLIDLQSKNGSFVNGKPVSSHWLKPGDTINIGKHSLVFCYSENEDLPEYQTDEIDKTMIMETCQYRSMVNENSEEKAAEPSVSDKKRDTIGIISFLKGGSGKYKCRKSITKIGKHPESDIVVKGFMVGSTSAIISKRPDGFYLNYVGGMAKPKVNEKKVKVETILNDSDVINVGACRMQFFERKPRKSKEKKIEKKHADPQASPE